MNQRLSEDIRSHMHIPYGLRRVPQSKFGMLLPCQISPEAGDMR